MVRAADKEDDLFALASKGGTPEAEAGLPVGGILQGTGPGRVSDPGFETRVKPPKEEPSKKAAEPKERKPLGRNTATDRQAAELAEIIEEKIAVVFGLLTSAMPVTGMYGVENSPKAVRALLDIGKRRPAVMRALLKIADGADGMEIGKFILGIAFAIQVDLGKLQGDELPARVTGVTEILEKYFSDENAAAPENPGMTSQATNVPRFQPVS